ncbi:LVIVD repeat-containing protein [Amycolatopsis sp. NPDC101161]|uniref:LVIVD repeat-containing protein n=1 Tax=Amycolatopsis sp. NPDC101161 TaxID=3363940 RepID=UPI003830162D
MRRSRSVLLSGLFGLVFLGSAVPASAAPDAGRPPAGTVLDNFTFVGHSGLDGFGDYGDLYAHGNYAYIGSRCAAAHQGGDGVQVVDISRPNRPRLVSKLPNPAYTRAEDVTVLDVHTPSFTGALAVVGIQACFGSGHEAEVVPGVRLFNVTDPAHPALLGHWDLPQGTIGCHEIDAVQRADGQVLVACARNLVDHRNSKGATALHLIDATNPAGPTTRADWSLNVDPNQGVGCTAAQFAHSARFEDGGNSVYVSYWDAGTVHLDISKPAAPAVVSDTKITPPDEDGDNHSMTLAHNGQWLIINTEDTSPADCPGDSAFGGWGEVHVYDNSNPKQPVFLGTFSTSDSRSTRTDGEFTDHNTEVAAHDQFFSSWYSDGIVWWTMTGHGVSAQRGQFVPPPNSDGSSSEVWGVYVDKIHNVILASDITNGLWIVKPNRLGSF